MRVILRIAQQNLKPAAFDRQFGGHAMEKTSHPAGEAATDETLPP
jgi:hypothetical protein